MSFVCVDSEAGHRYTDGAYLERNPTWHVEDSPWKAEKILDMLARHGMTPTTICEVGCGAGEVLAQLQKRLPDHCRFWGYDISPQAHRLAIERANSRLQFRQADLLAEHDLAFDLLLVIDLIEHLDDYYGFLRRLKPRSRHTIFHIPLDLSAYAVWRSYPILDLRTSVGHIHYFTKDTALAALRDTGYEVLDWFYPEQPLILRGKPMRQKVLALLRQGLLRANRDLAVRVLGGRSLMVLAR
ncbi:MAG TPA: class I SAM-dependent methyltransferase [Pirellulales bacterium]|nr:class I SAM-dependent methyltransferase [Pirellulales bacterium]